MGRILIFLLAAVACVGGFAEPSKCRVFVHDNARDRTEIPVNVWEGKIILDRIDGLSAAFWIQGE